VADGPSLGGGGPLLDGAAPTRTVELVRCAVEVVGAFGECGVAAPAAAAAAAAAAADDAAAAAAIDPSAPAAAAAPTTDAAVVAADVLAVDVAATAVAADTPTTAGAAAAACAAYADWEVPSIPLHPRTAAGHTDAFQAASDGHAATSSSAPSTPCSSTSRTNDR